MKKLTILLAVAILLLNSATKAQTNASSNSTSKEWIAVVAAKDDGQVFYVLNDTPLEWNDDYVAQWTKSSGTFEHEGKKYYNATQLELLIVNCKTKESAMARLVLRDSNGTLVYNFNYEDELDVQYPVPGSIQERINEAVCIQNSVRNQ